MIKLELSILIFFYMLVSVIGLIGFWAFTGYRNTRKPARRERELIWKCQICLNDYLDSKSEDISVCPTCGSYNKKEGVK